VRSRKREYRPVSFCANPIENLFDGFDSSNPTKIIQSCSMNLIDLNALDPVKTDCSFEGGASGTGHLVETTAGIFLTATAVQTFAPNSNLPFDPDRHYNTAVPVTGEFRQAILDTMSAP
jgi:hypothetical protein